MALEPKRKQTQAFVALGSNVGDCEEILRGALAAMEGLPDTGIVARSSWLRSEPVGGPAQPDYLNGVVQLDTRLGPLELLDELQTIETQFGRDRSREKRWGPRSLDLDILLYGEMCCHTERLLLPHPRMEGRSFVLEPLAELLPDWRLVGCGLTVREQCENLRAKAGV